MDFTNICLFIGIEIIMEKSTKRVLEKVNVKKGTLQNLQSAHSDFLIHSDFKEFNSRSNNDISLIFILQFFLANIY